MASIGKVALSAASGMQEATFALSNINFDFSLIKLDAPLEYRELGALLSVSRKRDAEEGPTHTTARKLGALFADDLPHVPHLMSAYGLREAIRMDLFADLVGADGTSIWAAATSGKGALEVHLLACILARTWPAAQAISIWYELIAARKAVLQKRTLESDFHISTITAAQIEVSREQLAAWDCSARSWLRTADAAKRLQQTQLMLILDNVQLRVQMGSMLYDGVMTVWVKALNIIDKLTSGIAQSIENAGNIGVLIGLSAWHLYPDMHVLAQQDQTIYQKDEFVKRGGLLTLGLQGAPRDTQSTGISWSMPLKTLRYYGQPVKSQQQVDLGSSRVTFDRILKIAFGSVISGWRNDATDLEEVMNMRSEDDDSADFWLQRPIIQLHASVWANPQSLDLIDERQRVNKLREFSKRFNRVPGLQKAIIRYHHYHSKGFRQNPVSEFASLLPQCDLGNGQEIYRRWTPMRNSIEEFPESDIEEHVVLNDGEEVMSGYSEFEFHDP